MTVGWKNQFSTDWDADDDRRFCLIMREGFEQTVLIPHSDLELFKWKNFNNGE